jgi:hypothetical protein
LSKARERLFPAEIPELDAATFSAFAFHAGGGPAVYLRVHEASMASNPPLAGLLRSQRARDLVAFAAIDPALRRAQDVGEAQVNEVRRYEIEIAHQLADWKNPLAAVAREFLAEMAAAGHAGAMRCQTG